MDFDLHRVNGIDEVLNNPEKRDDVSQTLDQHSMEHVKKDLMINDGRDELPSRTRNSSLLLA